MSGSINDRRTERNNKNIRGTAQVVEQFYRQKVERQGLDGSDMCIGEIADLMV